MNNVDFYREASAVISTPKPGSKPCPSGNCDSEGYPLDAYGKRLVNTSPPIYATLAPKSLRVPTMGPTYAPTMSPTYAPTMGPTYAPTMGPTYAPTMGPTYAPTMGPTYAPTMNPTMNPTMRPTMNPTMNPTMRPTMRPTMGPTYAPTMGPTYAPMIIPKPDILNLSTLTRVRRPIRNRQKLLTENYQAANSNTNYYLGISFIIVVAVSIICYLIYKNRMAQPNQGN